MTLSNRLLNSTSFGLSGFPKFPDDGAGAGGTGEPSAPAAADSGSTPAIGTTVGVSETPEPDTDADQFAMPSDEALFALDEAGEVVNTPSTPPVSTPAAGTPPSGTTPPAGAPPAAATPPQAGTQPPAPAPAQAQVPAGTTPPAQTPPAQAEQPAPAQVGLPHEVFVQALDANREAFVKELTGQYAISEADAEKLGILDAAPLSGLAANLHFSVMRAATQMMLQTLPGAITQIVERNNNAEKQIGAFYAEHPELNRETDHSLVSQYATMYWQNNPKGTVADMRKQVGTMAKAHLGKLTASTPPAAQTPPAGVAPKKVPPKQTPSFTPAGTQGGSPAAKAVPQSGDVWGNLSEKMAQPDDD